MEAITFDAGGTLIWPYPSVGEVYARVLSRFGIQIDPPKVESDFRITFKQMRGVDRKTVSDDSERAFWRGIVETVLGPHIPPAEFDVVFNELYETFASSQCWRLAEDALYTLIELRKRGYRLAILSNADSRFRQVFSEMGITELVEQVFISSEIGWEKPDQRIFRHVEKKLGLAPHQILHIGDSPHHDIEGATNAGWHHLLLDGDDSKSEFSSIKKLSKLLYLLPNNP